MASEAYKLDGYESTVGSTEMTVRSEGLIHASALLVCLREHGFALLEKRREHACACDENRDRSEREKRDARPAATSVRKTHEDNLQEKQEARHLARSLCILMT